MLLRVAFWRGGQHGQEQTEDQQTADDSSDQHCQTPILCSIGLQVEGHGCENFESALSNRFDHFANGLNDDLRSVQMNPMAGVRNDDMLAMRRCGRDATAFG
jgi:hypothetical protein